MFSSHECDGVLLMPRPVPQRKICQGHYTSKDQINAVSEFCLTFHRAGEQVVVAGIRVGKPLQVEIYSKDGEFVYCAEIAIDGGIRFVRGITMTTKGRIACVVNGKVIIF